MSDLKAIGPQGILRGGWSDLVNDYALNCFWGQGGKTLIVGDAAGGIYAFQGKSGESIWSNESHDGGLLALAAHPNGNLFATAGQDGCVLISETESGESSLNLNLGEGWIEHLSWSPEGTWLAAAFSRRVFVFDQQGNECWRSDEQPSTVSAIAWANDQELAIAGYGRVSFFNVTKGELSQQLEWQGSLVSMVLSPDGDIVACGSQDKSVHFWRRSTGEDSMMSGYPGKPGVLAFDSKGIVLATSGYEKVTVWSFEDDGPEGTRPGVLDLHAKSVTSLAFPVRGMRLASGAKDGSVAVWDIESDGQGEPVGVALMADPISKVVWRPDGRALAVTDAGGGICVMRVRS